MRAVSDTHFTAKGAVPRTRAAFPGTVHKVARAQVATHVPRPRAAMPLDIPTGTTRQRLPSTPWRPGQATLKNEPLSIETMPSRSPGGRGFGARLAGVRQKLPFDTIAHWHRYCGQSKAFPLRLDDLLPTGNSSRAER